MKNDIDNQTLTEMVSDPAIYNIFESFDLKTSASDSKRKRIKEALANIKKKRLLEAEEAEDDDDDDAGDEIDFDLSDFDEEDMVDEDEGSEEDSDPVMSALTQAKELLDQASDAYSGGTDEDDFEEEEDDDDDEEEVTDENLDLFERKERIKAYFEAKKGKTDKEKEKEEKAKAKEKKEKEKEKKAKAKEKEDAKKAADKEKADAKKAKAKEKEEKEKKAKADKKKKVKEAIRKNLLRRRIQERVDAIKAERIAEADTGSKVPGKYPKMPSKGKIGIQKQVGTKTTYPKAAKAATKGNLKPSHGSASDGKGQAVKGAGKYPGSPISKQKEAARKERIRNKIKEALAAMREAKKASE